MGFTGAEGLVDAMKKQNDHQWGRKVKVPFLKGKVKKTHPLEVRLKLILGPCRNLQILSQNLFNHCMGDATASLRANDRGFLSDLRECHELGATVNPDREFHFVEGKLQKK